MRVWKNYRKKIFIALIIWTAAWSLFVTVQQIGKKFKWIGFSILEKKSFMEDNNPIDQIHVKRRSNILEVCQSNGENQRGEVNRFTRFHMILSERYNITFCAIQKVASSFWRRLFLVIKKDSEFSSVFEVPLETAFLHKIKTLRTVKPENINKILNSSKKIIFVRHPYTRLYSAYIDKIFSVNPLYWNRSKSIVNYRENVDNRSKRCGHDVSFAEFVKYFQRDLFLKSDPHFIPMYIHCSPCKIHYDFIGKIESLNEDFHYILEKIGLKSLKKSLKMNKNLTNMDIILSKVESLLANYNFYKDCFTFYEAVERVWKELQIRGIIDKNINVLFSEKEITNFDMINVTKMFITAAEQSTDKKSLGRNKIKSLIAAYSSIDSEDFQNLRKMFRPDCELFNYDCDPENFMKKLSGKLL